MLFRNLALATTSLVALGLAASGASAGNMYAAKVNLGFGYAWENYGCDGGECSQDIDYSNAEGGGSVNIPYNDHVNFQLDAAAAASLDHAYNGGSFFGGFSADARVFWRDESIGALGVFAAVGRDNLGSIDSSDFVDYAAGVEGEYYCNNWTLRAQAGYLDSDRIGYLLQNAGFVNAKAIYYASQRLKLSAGVGYAAGTMRTGNRSSSFINSDEVTWSVGAEYLFGKSIPASVYFDYKGQDVTDHGNGNFGFTRNAVNIGVRFPFGVGSGEDIERNDREGVGYDPVDLIITPRVFF